MSSVEVIAGQLVKLRPINNRPAPVANRRQDAILRQILAEVQHASDCIGFRSAVWHDMTMQSKEFPERTFQSTLEGTEKGRVYVVLPFDPETVWGLRDRYHVRGTINGMRVRGALERFSIGYFLPLGPAYRRGTGLRPGDPVTVTLVPEGPQSEALAADIAAALEAEPEAARFFDGLATFHRKNYLRWIDATKRSPAVRQQRIEQLIELLKAGRKELRK